MHQVRLFIFGLGYSGLAVAEAMADRAEWIGGTVREAEKASRLRDEGIDALVFDGERPGNQVAEALGETTHLLVSIAPGDVGDRVLPHHARDVLAAGRLRWIGYLSSVAVYGDHGGAWISEATAPWPRPGRASARLGAESAWTALAGQRGVALGVFRLAGIYGPGRNAFVNLAEGRAHRIVKPGQVFNRIHVADIAQTVTAATERPANRIYNVADDEPAPPEEVIAFAASLMGVAPPPEVPFEKAKLSPMAMSFYADNRRVSNQRIKLELGVQLAYPTYREGLTALWTEGNWQG